jgi:thiaminase/transcriptional activator TenA
VSFTDDLIDRHGGLWRRLLEHPFVLRTRDGDMPDRTFATWLRQDYLFVKAGRRFVALLAGRAPERLHGPLTQALAALGEELELFRERAEALGADLDDVEPGLVNHAFRQYLLATVHGEGFPEALTVYWTAEKAYHECWKVVAEDLPADSPRGPLVENWAGDEFAQFVAWLGDELDRAAEEASESGRRRMEEHFVRTARYELAFWEMALRGPGWPGLTGPSGG